MFSRTDKITDSETFYTSIYETLHDPLEMEEVDDLLRWWNKSVILQPIAFSSIYASASRRIFPHESSMAPAKPIEGSALDRIRQKRAEKLAGMSDLESATEPGIRV